MRHRRKLSRQLARLALAASERGHDRLAWRLYYTWRFYRALAQL